MRIFHITTPANAVAIVESGKFYPASNHPLNNDNGLNCFLDKPGYWLDQCFEGRGARLILEWSGPTNNTPQNTQPPLSPNVLHDQFPWRCFIRGGTDPKHIRIIGIQFKKGEIEQLITIPSWHRILPTTARKNLARSARLNFFRGLREKYRNNQLFLMVVD